MFEQYSDVFSVKILQYDLKKFQPKLFQNVQKEIEKYEKKYDDVDELNNPWNDLIDTTFHYENIENARKLKDVDTLNKIIIKLSEMYHYSLTKETREFFVHESFINFYKKYGHQELHNHAGNALSCVYYHKAPIDSGNIVFDNLAVHSCLSPDLTYCMSNFSITPSDGMILVFPSWLFHKVKPNLTDSLKITLAFNLRKENEKNV